MDKTLAVHLLGAFVGALVGLLLVWLQIQGLKHYAKGKDERTAAHAQNALGQVFGSNIIGMPLIFAVVGYMAAAYLWPNL